MVAEYLASEVRQMFTHILNPFRAKPGSEHERAQKVTFASLRTAVDVARRADLTVEVLCPVLPGDESAVESPGIPKPLTRSVQAVRRIKPIRQFPILRDLLEVAASEGKGEHVIYTNADIAVQPQFYIALKELLNAGKKCFSVTRRTLANNYSGPEELPAMYCDPGSPHCGHDCFVLPKSYISRLELGTSCIGAPQFDWLLIANLDALSDGCFDILRDEMLTFHIGDDRAWLARVHYDEHNFRECVLGLERLAKLYKPKPGTHYDFLLTGFRHHSDLGSRMRRWIKNRMILAGIHRPKIPNG